MARILITGCTSGIGRACAVHMAAHGHEVVATGLDIASIEELDAIAHLQLDVTSQASIDAAIARAGRIDVLINNAGRSMYGPAEVLPLTYAEQVIQINFIGVMRMCQAVLPQMRERRSGRIIQVSSAGALRPQAYFAAYCASKAALDSYSRALREEVRPFGVDVTSMILGRVSTDIDNNRLKCGAQGTEYEGAMAPLVQGSAALTASGVDPFEPAALALRLIEASSTAFHNYLDEAFAAEVRQSMAMSEN